MNLTYPEQLAVIQRHQATAPVQTVTLASDLGLSVWHVPNWPDDLAGKIVRSADQGGASGYAIYVNKGHHVNRRRFTTAHEIAHFILHRQFIGDGLVDDGLYRSRLSNSMEAQANKLAADILMPRHLLNQQIANGVTTVAQLAAIFQVSESAMSIRVGAPN
ncbi:MAG: ImmA/IrrE family metallo-endopeptidase [Pseudomonadota bacterium]